VPLMLRNIAGYWDAARELVPMPVGVLSHAAVAAIVMLALAGGWAAACGADAADRSRRALRARLACVPLALWYLLAYLAVLALASISPDPRYWTPVLPIVLALAVAGFSFLAKRNAHPRRVAVACAAALAVYYAFLHASARELRDDELATCGPCRELYAFVNAHTPPGSVIAFAKPRALALLADRPGWIWNPDYGAGVFRPKLRERASFLVIAAPGTALRERYPPYVDARFEAGIGAPIFRNSMFTVVDIRKPAPR
jgi:hypothetical protein